VFLEVVRINGFKSFAQETSIDFKPGIGVIIGSNGVGKSNILDAIAWSLGETDLASLRCQKYLDLFFSGSDGCPEAGEIRVELIISAAGDRDARPLKMAREADRRGKESFFEDGKAVDARHYREALAERGLGNAVRTIIRQEGINGLIHMNSGERVNYLSLLLGSRVTGSLADSINNDFRLFLKELLPGGDGAVRLDNTGGAPVLEVEAAFPGKAMRNAVLLSGGEKTICSLALSLAFFERLGSPLYLFDEVEPSLDWTNHHHMQSLFRKLSQKRQLLMITHLRSTIELADTLHGVRARGDGTSYVKFYFEMNERLLRAYKCC